MRHRWLLGILVITALAAVIGIIWVPQVWRQSAGSLPEETSDSPAPAAKKFSFAQSLDLPGIANPEFIAAEKSGLQDDEVVIGVAALGEARAYLRSAFFNRPDRHIVNDKFGSVPVTVIYCDRTLHTRVLTRDKSDAPLNIRCGGWTEKQEMSLLVDDLEFALPAKDIPLQDLPYEVTTWKKWREAHADTLVYVGGTK